MTIETLTAQHGASAKVAEWLGWVALRAAGMTTAATAATASGQAAPSTIYLTSTPRVVLANLVAPKEPA